MRSFRVLAVTGAASLTVVLASPLGVQAAEETPVFQVEQLPASPPPLVEPSFEVGQIPVSPAPAPLEQAAAVPDVPDMQVQVGRSFRYHIEAPADTYVAVVSGLPAGLVFHPLTSEIIGTPAASPEGEYLVGITTYNRRGEVGNGSFVMTLMRADASGSLLQELLSSPQRGLERIKELVDRLLGTKLARGSEPEKPAE